MAPPDPAYTRADADAINRATYALAATRPPEKHSQQCPVWRHKADPDRCGCWIWSDADRDVRTVVRALATNPDQGSGS